MKIILSLDGGGIRGILSAAVLLYLEQKIQDIMGDSRLRIANLVDFVAGTSTGSIIGGLMLIPEIGDNGYISPKYNMSDIVQMYVELGSKVFKKNDLRYNIKTLWGLSGPKFPANNIECPLLKFMDHHKLGDLIKPCMFTGYDITKRKVNFYTNSDIGQKYINYYLKDIVRGSASIPSVFSPAYFNEGVDFNTIIDGGIFANNPSLAAFIEISKTVFKNQEIKKLNHHDVLIISMGTGDFSKKSYSYEKTKKWGKAQWLSPIIDIMLTSHSEVTNYEMEKIFNSNDAPHNYKRLNPPIVLGSSNSMDSSMENITRLLMDAQNYINNNREMLNTLAREICDLNYLINYMDE